MTAPRRTRAGDSGPAAFVPWRAVLGLAAGLCLLTLAVTLGVLADLGAYDEVILTSAGIGLLASSTGFLWYLSSGRGADDDQALTVAHGALDESANENKRLFDALTAAEARVRELEAALRELRDQHVSDPADVPNVYDFDDDAYCEALESALRRADALLAAPTHGGRGSGEQP